MSLTSNFSGLRDSVVSAWPTELVVLIPSRAVDRCTFERDGLNGSRSVVPDMSLFEESNGEVISD